MTMRRSVFGSNSERKLYKDLTSRWGSKMNIYHNLPFCNIFDINTLDVLPQERDYLLKTSVDYVICSRTTDMPLMCIEFDGMNEGYSKGTEYVSPIKNDLRSKKIELKLKIFDEHKIPLFVVSFHEKNQLEDEINLSILDGIIGQTVYKTEFSNILKHDLSELIPIDISSWSEYERREYIQDFIMSLEIEQELTWDPIAKKASEIHVALLTNGVETTHGFEFVHRPELPDIKGMDDYDGLHARLNALKNVSWVGCKFYCETRKGRVSETAWVRNFEGDLVSPTTIAHNIAELLVFDKVAQLFNIKTKESPE